MISIKFVTFTFIDLWEQEQDSTTKIHCYPIQLEMTIIIVMMFYVTSGCVRIIT